MRKIKHYSISDTERLAENLAYEVAKSSPGILLRGKDRNPIPGTNLTGRFDLAAGLGAVARCTPDNNRLEQLERFLLDYSDWIFGYFSYDLKNELEQLRSTNLDGIKLPALSFFVPRLLLILNGSGLEVGYHPEISDEKEVDELVERLLNRIVPKFRPVTVEFTSRFTRSRYLETVQRVKNHIARGDIYELNLCQEFYSQGVSIDPPAVFNRLYRISPTPFGAFLRDGSGWLLCASPERYLRREGELLVSQPIKGTASRGSSKTEDIELARMLQEDRKERAENVMIVDLVRNDLSKVAQRGSVQVNELCGVYPFRQVYQLISTVSCKLSPCTSIIEPIRASFPMGSMTGAPKVRAMELIEDFEHTKRGLYSGAVGYFAPNGDFDFNVVIRSLLYNSESGYLSFTVGGAITAKSDPVREYQECLLKAKAILQTLQSERNDAE